MVEDLFDDGRRHELVEITDLELAYARKIIVFTMEHEPLVLMVAARFDERPAIGNWPLVFGESHQVEERREQIMMARPVARIDRWSAISKHQ